MNIFSKILCAIDFSEHSFHVLQWTQYLEKRFESQVVVLHVRRNPSSYVFVPDLRVGEEDTSSIPAMIEFQKQLKSANVEYEALLSTGFAADKILQLSIDLNATMIIMGTRGMTGVKRAILGSVAEKVIRNSEIPVLTIPPGASTVSVSEHPRILLPLSSIEGMPQNVQALSRIFREFDASLHLIHVVKLDDEMFDERFSANPFLVCAYENDDKMQASLKIAMEITGAQDPSQVILRYGNVADEILKQIAASQADLVIMPVKKETLLNRFTLSTSDEVISHSNIPVLTLVMGPSEEHSKPVDQHEADKQGGNMRTIIVATDFSPPSRRAFSYGVHLARRMKADLLCVYVLNNSDLRFAIHEELPDIMSNSTPQLRQAVEDYIAKRFKSLLRRYGHAYENISTCYVRGVPSIEIARIARERSAELVIVGTRCRSGLTDLLLGSTTRELLRRAPCPVLVLRVDTGAHMAPVIAAARSSEISSSEKQL